MGDAGLLEDDGEVVPEDGISARRPGDIAQRREKARVDEDAVDEVQKAVGEQRRSEKSGREHGSRQVHGVVVERPRETGSWTGQMVFGCRSYKFY